MAFQKLPPLGARQRPSFCATHLDSPRGEAQRALVWQSYLHELPILNLNGGGQHVQTATPHSSFILQLIEPERGICTEASKGANRFPVLYAWCH